MIKPTPGRVVWYMPGTEREALGGGDDVLAAIITYVHSDRLVNLTVFGVDGTVHPRTSVKLLQDDEMEDYLGQPHAIWMPYQKGQAAKTEALETKSELRSKLAADPVPPAEPPKPTTYQERVVLAKADLDAKLAKLQAFFSTETFAGLSVPETERLHRQAICMQEYSAVLAERVRAFDPDDFPF